MIRLRRSMIVLCLLALAVHAVAQTTPPKKKPVKRHAAKRPVKPVKPLPPPEPVHVGIQGAETLAPFYQALAALKESPTGESTAPAPDLAGEKASAPDAVRVVRILHFGDSHIAADILTRQLRDAFQSRYGDAGPGLVLPGPVFRGYRRVGVRVAAPVRSWQGSTLRSQSGGQLLGLPGAALHPLHGKGSGGTAMATGHFSSFELAIAEASGEPPCVKISLDDNGESPVEKEQRTGPYGALTLIRNRDPLPLDEHTLKFTDCGDGTHILGLDLRTGLHGVIYDSFGINGAQFVDLERQHPALRTELLPRLSPTLIVVSYGTNEMGRKGLTYDDYHAEVLRLLRALRADAGATPVLVTGPTDRLGRTVKTRDAFRERSDLVISALRDAAHETGCAFWDARAAMGGYGSFLRWQRSALGRPDHVHFTEAGYALLARMLFDELMTAQHEPQ